MQADGRPRVAVLIGAEAYQAYHVADIAFELGEREDVDVEIIALLPQALDQLARLERNERDCSIPRRLLHVSPSLRLLQKLRLFGSLKTLVMRDKRNLALLSSFDAIVTPTDHARELRPLLDPLPVMIYVNHGIGGRAASYSDKYLGFDYVLVAGRNDENRLLADRRIRPGRYSVIGYPKFDAARRIANRSAPLFDNDRPIVLFNPHSRRALRSWERFARPLIRHAVRSGEFNLIVAPHAKLFGRRPRFQWRRWERLAQPGRVIVDLGSERSLDMTYSVAADIYAGDVSSQVYEFLSEPKPCVFLNAHGVSWRGNRDFPTWDLGDVADTPAEAIEALRNACARHPLYVERQRDRMEAIVDPAPGAATRGADAITRFLRSRAKPEQAQRVMLLVSDLGTGGTARATLHVANGLAEFGYDVSLLVTDPGGVLTAELDARVKLIQLQTRRNRGPAMLLAVRDIARWIRSERPHTILSAGNHMHVAATFAHALAGSRGELALKLTNPIQRPNASAVTNGARRLWYRWAFGRADRVLTITRAASEEIACAYPQAAGKLHVVDNPYITDAMLQTGAGPRQFHEGRLLAIGRLVEQKNYALMLQALAKLSDLKWTLDVLGDGPQRESLERLAASLGTAERVAFHGYVVDPLPFLGRAHALLLSSAWEGQGAVLLEALACGCPVIATRSTAAVQDVLGGGRYGTLVPPGDVDALAAAIAAQLRQRRKLSPETRDWVDRYRIDAGVRSHVEALGLAPV